MSVSQEEIIIVGAGLSGLACALKLQEAGHEFLLLEASDGPGGRVRTDEVDGFLLDRGFQVYLDAYPTAGELLDLPQLNLHTFEPGAFVFKGKKLHRMMDVFRRPQYLLTSAFSPIGTLWDKVRVACLRYSLTRSSAQEIAKTPELPTRDFLKKYGFSDGMIEDFFGSFYGGIFLERALRTSNRQFQFTFKMFAKGAATLPAGGIGQITKQLADRIPQARIRYQCSVSAIRENEISLTSGETLSAQKIILATPYHVTSTLLPDLKIPEFGWRAVTNLYFQAPHSPVQEPIIILNGENKGRVNNVAVLSDVCPTYAPSGQSLISVSLLGLFEEENLPETVKKELQQWFGQQVTQWKHLRTNRIPHALPEQLPNAPIIHHPKPPLYLCGDYGTSTSIEGAIISGQQAAQRVLAK